MSGIAPLAETATLIGETTRTAMLVALMDGRALTAGELAKCSGVTPATASGHLARLVSGGLLLVTAQGRHRYYRLASRSVASMIERMMGVAGMVDAARRTRPVVTGPAELALRHARRCYDHLAGSVAVQIADYLVKSSYLEWDFERALMTPSGMEFLGRLGVDVGMQTSTLAGRADNRSFCRPCLDWSERRPHLAGAIGRALLRLFINRHWIRETPASRACVVTGLGRAELAAHFDIR